MKKIFALSVFVFFLSVSRSTVFAQDTRFFPTDAVATESSEASSSASESGVIFKESRPLVNEGNITQASGQTADRLESILQTEKLGNFGPTNFLQYAVRRAVDNGVSATTVAFILIFPLVASLIAFARHIIGLSGLSMYAPAALAVALLSMGMFRGSFLFFSILLFATIGRRLLQGFKLPYLPRTAMILWLVSFGVFGLLVLSTYVQLLSLSVLNVFALLILILLSENFLEISSASSSTVALQRVFETFILGVLCTLVLRSQLIQSFVLLYPELTFLLIGLLNFVIGRYLGLRFTEWIRFRRLSEEQE
ncbi:MAG: 7TM domain-containing protein [Candidatus Woesebacteria bacterium]